MVKKCKHVKYDNVSDRVYHLTTDFNDKYSWLTRMIKQDSKTICWNSYRLFKKKNTIFTGQVKAAVEQPLDTLICSKTATLYTEVFQKKTLIGTILFAISMCHPVCLLIQLIDLVLDEIFLKHFQNIIFSLDRVNF